MIGPRAAASMPEVVRFLRERASDFARRPTPENLADSLSVERFPYPYDGRWYRALLRFRKLRQDARVATARRALMGDA